MSEDLFDEGLLKKIPPSWEKCVKSLEISENYLEESKTALRVKIYNSSILASYNSMFHAARAALFLKGVKERSHYAIVEYLLQNCKKELGTDLINQLDSYRLMRHTVSYGLDAKISVDDAESAIEFAEKFLEKIEDFVENEKR